MRGGLGLLFGCEMPVRPDVGFRVSCPLAPTSRCGNAGRCDMGALLKPAEMGKSFAVMSYGDLAARCAPNSWNPFAAGSATAGFVSMVLDCITLHARFLLAILLSGGCSCMPAMRFH